MAERTTGTRDVTYDLISVSYHALQGAETANTYIEDAENEGDAALATFFREVQQRNRDVANQAIELLGERMGKRASR
jgi:hypothetical protein